MHAQLPNLVKGNIIDSIHVGAGMGDSFALYLPQRYREYEHSPIVFIFHPAAQGRHGLLPFLEASEKYGYILVCSNDSRNGPYDENYEISNRLFNKVFNDFNIDPNRIYTAGFSGGARLASSIAVISGQIQGVIACGAGFSPNEMAIDPGFSYAAIVGNRDFNYRELLRTRAWLDKLKIPNELFEYEMGHQWPDSSQVLKAFKWLQLETYRKGLLPADTLEVMDYYRNFYNEARSLEENGELIPAAAEYERIVRIFKDYFGLDSIRRKSENIIKGRLYKQQNRQWLRSLETETALIQRHYERLSESLTIPNPDSSWWENEFDRLRLRYNNSEPFARNMIERVLSTTSAMAYEAANNKPESLSPQQKMFCYDLCILAFPDQPYAYFRQIELQILEGNMDMALNYLEKLIQSGYGHLELLKNHSIVQPLKTHSRFNELLPP
jgi:predicted esterase